MLSFLTSPLNLNGVILTSADQGLPIRPEGH
jgi:hypothetical protein